MAFENTDIWGGQTGNDVFGSGLSTAGTGANPNGISWTDKIFGTITDFGTSYLSGLGQGSLDNLAIKNAARNQAGMLGYTELPQNVGASPVQTYMPAPATSGIDKNTLLIAAAVVAVLVLVK